MASPRSWRPNGGWLLPGLAAFALASLGILVVSLVMTRGGEASQAEIDAARTATEQSVAKQAELQGTLDAAQQRLSDLEAAQTRNQSEAEARATKAEGEVRTLGDQLTKAEADLKTEKDARARLDRRVQALVECLNGTTVALQFGRTGSWDPADRALAAVSAACSEAQTLR